MVEVVAVGISHNTAPVEVRECFSLSQEALEQGLSRLYERGHVDECVVLSTCNRVEVYAASSSPEECIEEIKDWFVGLGDARREHLGRYFYTLTGNRAVGHLFRVSSSLDSMVVGEPQILGQVKQAYRVAHGLGTTGIILNRLFHYAFFVAKRVRHETRIGSQAVSVSYAATQLAERIFDNLSHRTTLLIGAGEMGELAARHLVGAGIKELIIASRTQESALELAGRLGGTAIRIEEVPYFLRRADIVITATGSSDFIVKKTHILEAMKLRRNEPMFLIDIAVPRDIDPRVEEIENVYLYDIDDLKGVLDENMKTRRKHAEKAEEIVRAGVTYFRSWLDGLRVVPTIISITRKFESIKAQEVEKALRRLGDYSDKERKIIEGMAEAIVGKILHSPITNLKREASTSLGVSYSSAIRELFDLDSKFEIVEEDEAQA
jgi:glutamyl-tRNA reductase